MTLADASYFRVICTHIFTYFSFVHSLINFITHNTRIQIHTHTRNLHAHSHNINASNI